LINPCTAADHLALLTRLAERCLTPRGEIPASVGIAASALGVGAVLLAWVTLSYGGLADPMFFPSPGAVYGAFRESLEGGALLKHVWASLVVINIGFLLSSIMAVPLGLMMATFKIVQAAFEPAINFIRYLPVTAMIPLLILWVGIGIEQKITVIIIGTFFQQVVMVVDIVNRVPNELLNAAYTLGASRRQILSRVLVPAMLPGAMDMLRVTMGWAWTYLVVAELVGSSSGLGYMSMQGMRGLHADIIFVAILAIGALGIITDQIFRVLKRVLLPWSEI
jgi:NitT/TauT family transport system permease protein